MYFLTVLEARRLKSRCEPAMFSWRPRECLSTPPPLPAGSHSHTCPLALGAQWQLCRCLHVVFSMFLRATKSICLYEATSRWSKAHSNPGWHHLSSITPAMILFPKESQSKEIKLANPKGNQSWLFTGRNDAETPILWPPDSKSWLIGKDPDTGKD